MFIDDLTVLIHTNKDELGIEAVLQIVNKIYKYFENYSLKLNS